MISTVCEVSKYAVFSGLYFPVFELNTFQIYFVNVRFSPNTGKYGPGKTPNLRTFHAVIINRKHHSLCSMVCTFCYNVEEDMTKPAKYLV